jgi:hypothetical protein
MLGADEGIMGLGAAFIMDKDGKPVAKIHGRIKRIAEGYTVKWIEKRPHQHHQPKPLTAKDMEMKGLGGDLSSVF